MLAPQAKQALWPIGSGRRKLAIREQLEAQSGAKVREELARHGHFAGGGGAAGRAPSQAR